MARRVARDTDLNAISDVVLANFPSLAAMVASGGFLPVEHVRRKLNDGNVVMAYDTAGGIVGLRYLLEENAVVIEIAGTAALSSASRLALWRLARGEVRTRKALTNATRLHLECMEGSPVDTFLAARFPALRTVINTVGTGSEVAGPQPVTYRTTLGAL